LNFIWKDELANRLSLLEKMISEIKNDSDNLNKIIKYKFGQLEMTTNNFNNNEPLSFKEKIAVLVIACRRSEAVESLLNQIINTRANNNLIEKFPIVVSLDCDHSQTMQTVQKFSNQIYDIMKVFIYFFILKKCFNTTY
jgi:hypothetical protein